MSFIPNTTPTPNWLLNGEMKKMNETELKVVLLVIRKTLGWFDPMTKERKEQDYISQKQFMEFTGKSNRAIATAIQTCVKIGWIIAKDKKGHLCNTAEKRARRKIWYQLGTVFIKKISGELSSQENKSGEHFSKSGEHNDINLVNNVHSTKETITKETIQNSEKNFSSSNYINQMTKDKQKHIRIIGWYFQTAQMEFPSLKAVRKEIKRHLDDASVLVEYTDAKVAKAVNYVKKKFPEEWNLGTVLKYINKI